MSGVISPLGTKYMLTMYLCWSRSVLGRLYESCEIIVAYSKASLSGLMRYASAKKIYMGAQLRSRE